MDQEEKQKIKNLILEALVIEDESEIQDDSQFILDLNASKQDLLDIIKTIEENQDIDLEITSQDIETLTVGTLIERIEEELLQS